MIFGQTMMNRQSNESADQVLSIARLGLLIGVVSVV